MNRRFAALAASAFLINLNVVVVDRACGSRHETTPVAHEHAGHAHHTPVPEQHEAPRKCCDALSTCGATLSLGGEILESPIAPSSTLAMRVDGRSPSSVPRAPEPPPPKA